LRRHRDEWWAYCAQFREEDKPAGFNEEPGSGRGRSIHRRKVGVLWSHLANVDASVEVVEFEGRLVAEESRVEGKAGRSSAATRSEQPASRVDAGHQVD
jgi:hypothetical protein